MQNCWPTEPLKGTSSFNFSSHPVPLRGFYFIFFPAGNQHSHIPILELTICHVIFHFVIALGSGVNQHSHIPMFELIVSQFHGITAGVFRYAMGEGYKDIQ